MVFGLLIALIGCHYGLRVKPNTESLGAGHHGLGGHLHHHGDSGGRAVCRGLQGGWHMSARSPHPVVDIQGLWSTFRSGTGEVT